MSDSRRLALELHEIRMLALSHATNPQFGNSSVDGEGIVFRDEEGNDIGRLGGNDNGLEIEYISAPKPYRPSTPVVTADANLIGVRWDGQWAAAEGGAVSDPDLLRAPTIERVEVHVSMDPDFVPHPILSFGGVLPVTDEGGSLVVGPLAEAGDYYVVLMARGRDGQYSVPSERVHVVTTVGAMENELFDLALRADEAMESADGKNSVYYGDDEPEAPEGGFKDGDLWFGPENMPHVWNPDAGSDGEWVSARDERLGAVQDAIDGLEDAVQNISISGGGTVTYWWDSPPDGSFDPPPKEGDLWFDTSGEANKLHRFSDGQWQSAADGRIEAIQDAYDLLESDLDEVRTSASGKNRTFYQSTMPATPPAQAGDLWFNTANGMRLHRNNGTTFIEVADGRIADLQDDVENIDISGPLSEARNEWLADAAADAQAKAQAAAAAAEAAAKLYADQIAAGVEDVDLEGFKDYADNAAEAARQAAIAAAIAEARLIADDARDEALQAALDADLVISGALAEFENDLDLVRQSADGKSRITYSTAVASGPGRAGDSWFRYAGTRLIGQWRHNGSSWVEMSLDPVVIPNLDAGKITSGYIDASRIAANSISADKLIIGATDNLIPWNPVSGVAPHVGANGTALTGTLHVKYGASILATGGDGVDRGYQSFISLRSGNRMPGVSGSEQWFALATGEKYRLSVKALPVGSLPAANASFMRFQIQFRDSNGVFLSQVFTPGVSVWGAVDPVSLVADLEPPENAAFMMLHVQKMFWSSGDVLLSEPSLRMKSSSVLIQDGAITANKIQAGAVGATAIAAESIDASKIVAGGIQADHILVPGTVGGTLIKDGAVTTSHIEAGSITASSGIIASLDAGVISSGFISSARIQAGSLDGGVVLTQGSVGSTVIAGGAITTEKIATGSITAESGIIASLDAGKITVGELDGSIIRAGTVTAEKLLVGNFTNLIPDPGALGSIHGSWYGYGSGSVGELGSSAFWRYSATSQGYRGVRVGNTEGAFGSVQWLASSKFQVKPGESYLIEVIAYRSELVGGFPRMGIRLGDADDAYMGETETVVMDQGGFHTYSAIVTIPNDLTIKYGRLRYTIPSSVTGGYAYFFSPVVRPAVGSTLIEPGAITTEHIRTGAITAESGIIGSLDAGVITTGELRGELIRAGSIAASALAADAIDGKTITGATVRTSAVGARVEMNAAGLRQYNALGQTIVDMTGGNVTVMGALYSGQVGFSRVQIDSQLWAGGQYIPREDGSMSQALGAGMRVGREAYHSIDIFHGEFTELNGSTGEAAAIRGPGESAAASIYLTDSGKSWWRSSFAGERRVDVSLFPENGAYQVGSDRGGVTRAALYQRAWGSGSAGHGHHQWWASSSSHSASVQMDLGHPQGTAESNMVYQVERSGGSQGNGLLRVGYNASRLQFGAAYVDAAVGSTGTSTLTLGGNSIRLSPNPGTTTGSANAIITGTGYFARTGSARALKVAIEAVDRRRGGAAFDDAFLSIPAVSWFDRGDAERLADYKTAVENDEWPDVVPDEISPLRRIPGVVAEDVHDAGLHEFVEYDENGEPSGVLYDRLGAGLIPVVARLRDRVSELEEKIGELTNA